jgi:hypothetical protein
MEKEIRKLLKKIPLHEIRLLVQKKVISSPKEFEEIFKDVLKSQDKRR